MAKYSPRIENSRAAVRAHIMADVCKRRNGDKVLQKNKINCRQFWLKSCCPMKWSCVTAFQICTASLVLLLFSGPVSSPDWLIGPQCHMHEGRGGWRSGSRAWGGVRWGGVRWVGGGPSPLW